MDDEICTLEKCGPESVDHELSQITSQDYAVEPEEGDPGSDVTGSMDDAEAYVDDITEDELKQTGSVDNEIESSAGIMDDSAVHSKRPIPGNAKSLIIVENDSDLLKKREKNIHGNSGVNPDSEFTHDELVARLEDAETRYGELETRFFLFEEKFNELQKKMTDKLDLSGDQLSTLENDLYSRAHESDFKRLRQDFDQFSRRLRRVVQAEDSVNAESLDPTKVPSDVLEITYAKTLNDIFNAMIAIYGDRESADMVESARDRVREFSAGVDFFRFENEVFVVRGLSDAISSKIVSVKQIHGTYVELFKMVSQYVPNYNSQDFRSFVETGSREYTIEKVVSHEKHLEKIVSDLHEHKGELDNLTENVSFIAELQNNQLEETTSNTQQLEDIKEQMKSIAKAVNLHTKAISKLNRTLKEFKSPDLSSSIETGETNVSDSPVPDAENAGIQDMSELKEIVTSKASKEEIMAIAGEIDSLKEFVGGMFTFLQEQLQIHIPGYKESINANNPEDVAQDDVFPEDSTDLNLQSDQVQQEEVFSDPLGANNEPEQLESSMQAEATELVSEPLGPEDFAPDQGMNQENNVHEAESIPVDFESVRETPMEATPEEVPLDLESLDLNLDDVPLGVESVEVVPEEVPLDLESLDISPDEVPDGLESEEVSPEEVPLDLESLDISPDEVPLGVESVEVVPEEVPLDIESLDISPDEVPVGLESEEVSPEEVPLDLESLDISPDEVPVGLESEEVSPEEVPLDLESLDINPDGVPVDFESAEVVPEEIPLDPESLDSSPDEGLAEPIELTLSEAEIVTQEPLEQPQPIRLKDMPIEEVIIGQLSIAGSATLKQLEKQIKASGYPIDFEKLSLVMGYLEQEQMVNTVKKGRYTFYSVTSTVNV